MLVTCTLLMIINNNTGQRLKAIYQNLWESWISTLFSYAKCSKFVSILNTFTRRFLDHSVVNSDSNAFSTINYSNTSCSQLPRHYWIDPISEKHQDMIIFQRYHSKPVIPRLFRSCMTFIINALVVGSILFWWR